MSRRSSPRRPRLEGARLSVALATTLACAAQPPQEARAPVQPAPPPVVAEPAVEGGASASAPSSEPERPGANASAETVLALVAKPNLWPLDIGSARRVLSALGSLRQEQPTPSHTSLVGGPFGPLNRYAVAYTLDAQRYWVFGSAGFFLEDPDEPGRCHHLEARLTRQLGKPRSAGSKAQAPPAVVWDMGDAITLSLAPSTPGGECRVLIASSGRAIEPEAVDEEDTGLIQ